MLSKSVRRIIPSTRLGSVLRIDKKKGQLLEEKQRDRQEGEQYQTLAQQYALEQMELERFRKLKQKDVITMFDQAMEDKRRVKEIEQKMDEVRQSPSIRSSNCRSYLCMRINKRFQS